MSEKRKEKMGVQSHGVRRDHGTEYRWSSGIQEENSEGPRITQSFVLLACFSQFSAYGKESFCKQKRIAWKIRGGRMTSRLIKPVLLNRGYVSFTSLKATKSLHCAGSKGLRNLKGSRGCSHSLTPPFCNYLSVL